MHQLVAAPQHGQLQCGLLGESAQVPLFRVAEMSGRVALVEAAVDEGVQTAGGLGSGRTGLKAAVGEEAGGRRTTPSRCGPA
jgi:hypothetical protein